jgi:hypothetical protein
MSKMKALLAAVALSVSGLAAASPTVPVLDVSGSLSGGFLSSDTFNFQVSKNGVYEADFTAGHSALGVALFGIFDKVGGSWKLVGDSVGSGSFDFTGNTQTQYKAVVGDFSLTGHRLPFGINVSAVTPPVPEPETWALMILGIALVAFKARPRKTSGSLNALSVA